mgnify:FL=1
MTVHKEKRTYTGKRPQPRADTRPRVEAGVAPGAPHAYFRDPSFAAPARIPAEQKRYKRDFVDAI